MPLSRRRSRAVLGAVMALTLALAACGGDDTDDGSPAPPSGGDTEPDEALEPVVIRWQFDTPPPPHPNSVAGMFFKEKIEERIPGSEVRLYFAGSLYSTNADALEAAALGNVEIVNGQYGKDVPFERGAAIFVQPAALTTVGAIANIYDTEHMAILRERMAERGITTVANASTTFYIGYAGRCPHPSTPADLAGLNIRSFDAISEPVIFGKWGANAISMSFADVPSALETGVLDGALTSVGGWGGIREQVPCYTAFGIGALGQDAYAYHASSVWLESLNDATRQVVIDTIRETADMSRLFTWCVDQKAINEFGTDDVNEPGMLIHPPEVVDLFYGRDLLGDDVTNAIAAALDDDIAPMVQSWFEEAQALSAAHPPGSHEIEHTDCVPIDELAAEYTAAAS